MLWHITLTMETGEERIFTRIGDEPAAALIARLQWQWPRAIVAWEVQDRRVRAPVVGE